MIGGRVQKRPAFRPVFQTFCVRTWEAEYQKKDVCAHVPQCLHMFPRRWSGVRGNDAKVMPNAYKKRYVVLRFFNTLLSYDGSAIQPRRKERSSAQSAAL